jgi:hypothetical protein
MENVGRAIENSFASPVEPPRDIAGSPKQGVGTGASFRRQRRRPRFPRADLWGGSYLLPRLFASPFTVLRRLFRCVNEFSTFVKKI